MTGDNGGYVTRAEMRANLEPITRDVTEIKGDVKTLLRQAAAEEAMSVARKFWVGTFAVCSMSLITILFYTLGR